MAQQLIYKVELQLQALVANITQHIVKLIFSYDLYDNTIIFLSGDLML
jgi:hypothetical protein